MIEFLAEAVALVGFLTYARGRPESGDAAEREAEPSRQQAADRKTKPQAPAAEAGSPVAKLLDGAAGAAQKAWSVVASWVGGDRAEASEEPSRSGERPKSSRTAPPPSGDSRAARGRRVLWTDPSPYRAPSKPEPEASKPAAPRQRVKPQAKHTGTNGDRPAQARASSTRPASSTEPASSAAPAEELRPGPPPAVVRDPVCGVELPWARSVSLRVEGTTFYFCSDACRAQFVKGRGHD
jgi:YHS domain-containing protein